MPHHPGRSGWLLEFILRFHQIKGRKGASPLGGIVDSQKFGNDEIRAILSDFRGGPRVVPIIRPDFLLVGSMAERVSSAARILHV